ncbi:MAG TPA: YHS domain-containing protein [Nitrospirae bacterium]|nr:YHS domain-containing protein [Nitrospirota bacterium]
MGKDPVCGMDIEEKDSAGISVHKGEKYYFCWLDFHSFKF